MANRPLLTPAANSPKQAKPAKIGRKPIIAAILYMAAADTSGYELCSGRTTGCTVSCLGFTGHGGIGVKRTKTAVIGTNGVQEARIRKAVAFMERREAFTGDLVREVAALERRARKLRGAPVIRLNGTTDVDWLKVPVVRNGRTFPHMFAAFPGVMFYDYTKRRGVATTRTNVTPRNYRVVFSRAETMANQIEAMRVLHDGGSVAVVFSTRKRQPLPTEWNGFRVVDADVHDFVFLHGDNVVLGLRAKGTTHRDRSGFVVQV
jgi:hypothetical protein